MSNEKQWAEFSEWFDSFSPAHMSTQRMLFEAWQAALASQPKPAPMLLTDEAIHKMGVEFGAQPEGVRHPDVESFARAIESAVLRKNGWGV